MHAQALDLAGAGDGSVPAVNQAMRKPERRTLRPQQLSAEKLEAMSGSGGNFVRYGWEYCFTCWSEACTCGASDTPMTVDEANAWFNDWGNALSNAYHY